MLDPNGNALPPQTNAQQGLKVAGQLTRKLDWSGHVKAELTSEVPKVIIAVLLLFPVGLNEGDKS